MEIRLLGTAGADGIPGLFSDDEVSRHAREIGGKELRTRAAALIDGVLKIDLPPETLMQLQRDGLSALDWTALIFTHSDDDHLAESEIQYAMYPFTDLDHLPYTIYANPAVASCIRARYPEWPIDIVETRSFVPFQHGAHQITPIRARHLEDEDCHNLIFERDGKSILYATDTGIWPEETFEFLARVRLDLLVIECTDGICPSDYVGHLNIKQCVEVVARLRSQSTLSRNSRVFTTHHSSRGNATHCDLERLLRPYNIEPGYDGLRIVV
jgi:phosphoribosyl 1,2-cyclic phosphate phosphodiesterase